MGKNILNICSIVRIMFLASVIVFMKSVDAQGQESGQPQIQPGGFTILNGERSVSIPFQEIDNHIVITARLNGKDLNLVLDSGMPIQGIVLLGCVKVDSLHLEYSGTTPVRGVGGDDIDASIAMNATLDIPNLRLFDQMVVVLPYNETQRLRLEERDGIIGFSIFENFVVDIDYKNHNLILTKPDLYELSSDVKKIPLDVTQNRIFVLAQITQIAGESIAATLVLDTGNRNALVLNLRSDNNVEMPSSTVPFDVYGLSAKLERKAGRIKNITIGGSTISNVLTTFNDGKDGSVPPFEKEGNLGNALLRHFDVTINVLENWMVLRPNSKFGEPFEFNMSGIQIERSADGTFIVDRMIPDSPAAKAGIRIGDKILGIDGRPSEQWKKTELHDHLKRSGETVRFKIERAGGISEIHMVLTRLI